MNTSSNVSFFDQQFHRDEGNDSGFNINYADANADSHGLNDRKLNFLSFLCSQDF